MGTFSRTWPWLALAVIVAFAVAVRTWRLDTAVLTHDEAFSWRLTQYPVGELCMRTGQDVHPPLYYVVLKCWDGAFGDSVWAMRGLSVVLGVAAVLLMYSLCFEALRHFDSWSSRTRESSEASPEVSRLRLQRNRVIQAGALLAAMLAALFSGQVEAARNARMYGLGVLLAGVSAWLLLRACRAAESRWSWWAGYGVAAALFCYTHNYAFFTLFGQALFVLALLIWPSEKGVRPLESQGGQTPFSRWQILSGFGYATLLAFILYLPWLPVLLEQMRQVKENYWMQQVNSRILEETLFTFSTGMPFEGQFLAHGWLGLLVLAAALALWRCPMAALLFLLQGFCPVILSAVASLGSGRSIFHEHLFVFGQYSLLGLWAVLWGALPGWPERCALAVALIGMAASGLATNLENRPSDAPPIVDAVAVLKEAAQPGDELWTGSPWELNQWRYYLERGGVANVKVRCRHSFPGKGHMVHIASISADEVIWTDADRQPAPGRVWVTGTHGAPLPEMRQVMSRDFGRQGNRSWSLTLFEKAKN